MQLYSHIHGLVSSFQQNSKTTMGLSTWEHQQSVPSLSNHTKGAPAPPCKGLNTAGLSRATSSSHLQQAQPKLGTLRKHLTSVSSDTHVLWTRDKRSLCNSLTFFQGKTNNIHSALPHRSHSLNCMLPPLVPSRLDTLCASSAMVLHLIIAETLSMIDSAIIVCILHAVPCWYTISFWQHWPVLTPIPVVTLLVALLPAQLLHLFDSTSGSRVTLISGFWICLGWSPSHWF